MFEINMNVIKALSSKTRTRILQKLLDKPRTLTELSKILGFSKSTLKEHVDFLIKAELIKVEKTNRKWKYFELTDKGRAIVGQKFREIVFTLFAIVFIAIFDFSLSFLKYHNSSVVSTKMIRSAPNNVITSNISNAFHLNNVNNNCFNMFFCLQKFFNFCLIILILFLFYLLFVSIARYYNYKKQTNYKKRVKNNINR